MNNYKGAKDALDRSLTFLIDATNIINTFEIENLDPKDLGKPWFEAYDKYHMISKRSIVVLLYSWSKLMIWNISCGIKMQLTFLPSISFATSAYQLDFRRLGKQRVEAMQIINVLEGRSSGWANHPAVKMWRGKVEALKLYCNCMIREWERRGYNNNMPYYEINGNSRHLDFYPVAAQ